MVSTRRSTSEAVGGTLASTLARKNAHIDALRREFKILHSSNAAETTNRTRPFVNHPPKNRASSGHNRGIRVARVVGCSEAGIEARQESGALCIVDKDLSWGQTGAAATFQGSKASSAYQLVTG
eukprot:m.60712 g.60712  ORF g.60712 m.60712 type:complete len:124 (-) comp9522_c0_seq1:1131-1502(-)